MAEDRELALVLRLVADQFQTELKKSQGTLAGFNDFIKDWRTQLTAAGTALFAVAKSTANYGDELAKAAQRIGTTVQETARLQHAARLSDTDLAGLATSVGYLSKHMLDAAQGNQEATQAFSRLGVTVTTTSGTLKGTTDILLELSDRFRLMPDGPEKLALAMSVLGKSAKEVLPLLNSNMREAFQETKVLGLEMSERTAKAAEAFNDELTRLQGAVKGVGNSLGEVLLPQFTSLSKALTTVTADAGSALRALLNLDKIEAPQLGVVQPDGGGRRLRVVPAPSPEEAKKFPTQPFFKTPEQAAAEEERLAKERARLAKELAEWGQEQERRARALNEIWQAGNRALEIQKKLIGEDLAAMFRREEIASEETKQRELEQERLGHQIVTDTQRQVRERETAFAKERQSLSQNLQAWIAYDQEVGASTELRYRHEMELLRANLAQQLHLTTAETGNLLIAWKNYDNALSEQILNRTTLTAQQRETVEIQTLTKLAQINKVASDDVFSGWAEGMRRYLRDTQTGFGLAADMARRTAQVMEQGFRTFFLDVMDGQINSVKDLFRGLLDFVKQIIAQIMAQLIATKVLEFGTGLLGGGLGGRLGALSASFRGAANPSLFGPGFASGGSFIVGGFGGTDSQRVGFMATPGERVIVETPDQQRSGGGMTVFNNITIQSGGGVRESSTGGAANWAQMARDIGKMIESKIVDEKRPGGLLNGLA